MTALIVSLSRNSRVLIAAVMATAAVGTIGASTEWVRWTSGVPIQPTPSAQIAPLLLSTKSAATKAPAKAGPTRTPAASHRPTARPTRATTRTRTTTVTRTTTAPPVTHTTTAPRVVTAGAFCSPPGATGVTKTGLAMRCQKASDDRYRWKRA